MTPWPARGILERRGFRRGEPGPLQLRESPAQSLRPAPRGPGAAVRRVYPVEGAAGETRAVRAIRTLEITRERGSDEIAVLAAGAPGDTSWPAETGHDSEAAEHDIPRLDPAGAFGFGVEMAHQMHFMPLDGGAPGILEALGAIVAARPGDAAWVQAAFADRTAELAPIVAGMEAEAARAAARGDEHSGMAGRHAAACAARAHSRHIAVSIRGILVSDDAQAAAAALDAAARRIGFGDDSLRVCAHGAGETAAWMAARDLADGPSFRAIAGNCRMWRDPARTMRWGRGRGMSPVIALSPGELAALLAVPRAASLPVRRRRGRAGGAAEAVEGFDLA